MATSGSDEPPVQVVEPPPVCAEHAKVAVLAPTLLSLMAAGSMLFLVSLLGMLVASMLALGIDDSAASRGNPMFPLYLLLKSISIGADVVFAVAWWLLTLRDHRLSIARRAAVVARLSAVALSLVNINSRLGGAFSLLTQVDWSLIYPCLLATHIISATWYVGALGHSVRDKPLYWAAVGYAGGMITVLGLIALESVLGNQNNQIAAAVQPMLFVGGFLTIACGYFMLVFGVFLMACRQLKVPPPRLCASMFARRLRPSHETALDSA